MLDVVCVRKLIKYVIFEAKLLEECKVNPIFDQRLFFLLGVTALTVVGTGLSAQAETPETKFSIGVGQIPEISLSESSNQMESVALSFDSEATNQTSTDSVEASINDASTKQLADSTASQETGSTPENNSTEPQQLQQTAPSQEAASFTPAPVPGTTTTSAAVLNKKSPISSQPTKPASNPRVAQTDIDVDAGRTTRGGSSYVGVAGNIGLGGDSSALGDGGFAVISKIGLTNVISVRPSAIINDNPTILLPVTYDFTIQRADPFDEPLPIAPYAGGGLAFSTGDDSEIGLLLSGGVDVPINAQFTATAGVNAAFFDDTDVGVLIGVGYNFTGF